MSKQPSPSEDSDSIQSYKYDVLISFRGPDTRNSFVDHLHSHLARKGIFTFKDDKQLPKGESISPQLLQAIQLSRASIIVFSKDYASSTWCLDEMAAIYDCRKFLKQVVFPVFYDVDPSHVRKQNGVYEDAFALHTKQFRNNSDKVAQWRRAMTHLAGTAGWDVRSRPESKLIEKLVEEVIEKLGYTYSRSADDLIGIQPHIEDLDRLLSLRSKNDGCRVLGIWGMDGIGKTTLATILYDKISYQFDACCFIENVSKIYEDGGHVAVQKQILCQTIEEKNIDTYSLAKISQVMRNRLCKIKLLIVLDNVEQLEQLEELDINPKFLHTGSRIIAITRDKHILQAYGANDVFEAKLMNREDAQTLLCRKAFKSDYPSSGFAELITKVLIYAQCLPLAVRVLGSFLFSRNASQWMSTLHKFEKKPPKKILKVLNVMYEELEKDEKEIFLHVACFFNGERKDYVSRILDACGLHPGINIPLLIEKSLITIKFEEIHMHEMLHKLGKQIVREQHPNKPNLWSRMWLYRDFHHAMITNSKAIKAKAIILNQKEDVSKFNQFRAEDLPEMENLEVLILYHTNFSGRQISLSDSLCYLLWNGYPFISLPSNFQPYRLVELHMPESSIEQLWTDAQNLPNLKRMDFSNSTNLKMTPCFEGILNLEWLNFTGCIKLSHVDPSIGLLEELVSLSLQRCTSLVSLDFGNAPRLKSLRYMCLSDCAKLENTPNFSGLSSLKYVDMDRCASLSRIHESVGGLPKLSFISLRDCTNLVGIADSLNEMTSLVTLHLSGCSKFSKVPLGGTAISPLRFFIYLDLSFCNIYEVPDAIGELRRLERLNLQGNNFTSLPSTLSCLHNLSYLNLSHCHKLRSLPLLPKERGPSDSVGRYFRTTSESRNHRSGLYIFDSILCIDRFHFGWLLTNWLQRLLTEPLQFRCGFDIILPWHGETNDSERICVIAKLFHHRFKGGSIVRINGPVMDVDWLGFLFYVTFELNNCHAEYSFPYNVHEMFSMPLPHPFYLSFESEYTEERFDMQLNLRRKKVGKHYIWTIYISQEHCHFVKTGADISFKARKGLIIKEWGMQVVTKENIEALEILLQNKDPREDGPLLAIDNVEENNHNFEPKIELPYNSLSEDTGSSKMGLRVDLPLHIIDYAKESSSSRWSFEPKIQLPYNWLVSKKDSIENDKTKGKEIDLFNLGLFTERPQ